MKVISHVAYTLREIDKFVNANIGFYHFHCDANLRDRQGRVLYRVALTYMKT
ncbi:hypothetical protein [Caudoviricetes sp.]|nr:hypothetical protein [Caudoviricetes sp.]